MTGRDSYCCPFCGAQIEHLATFKHHVREHRTAVCPCCKRYVRVVLHAVSVAKRDSCHALLASLIAKHKLKARLKRYGVYVPRAHKYFRCKNNTDENNEA